MITRKYIHRIETALENNPACALVGPRQSGKTTIAREIVKLHPDSIYLDMEDSRDYRKLTDPHAFFERFANVLIIIDEVQAKPDLFRELRPAMDALGVNGRFLLLGSAAPQFIHGVSEYLTGRVEFIEISPFLLTELPEGTQTDTHLLRGGFPRSFLAADNLHSMQWRKSYIQSYSQMEAANIFGTGFNQHTISNLWRMLAHSQAGLLNQSILAASLGVSVPTVKRYIDYLSASFHVRLLQPWFVNAKKRLVKTPKVYIRDSGLFMALLDIGDLQELLGHPAAGAAWEGYVIEQVAGSLPTGFALYFYRTSHGAEADIVVVKGLQPILVAEIKFSLAPVPSRGFYETIADLSPARSYIVIPRADEYPAPNGVTVCGLERFLKTITDLE